MHMAITEFTEEQIQILSKNPYTLNVTSTRIMFTKEAKERILELANQGKTIAQIMREMGYDPKMLTHHRTKNLIRLIRIEAESREGLHNGYKRRTPKRLTNAEIEELGQNPESYARLKAEIIYLREEVEFLKKVSQQAISGKRGK